MGGLRVKTEHCTAAGGLTAHRHTALNLLYTNTRVEQINTHTGKIRDRTKESLIRKGEQTGAGYINMFMLYLFKYVCRQTEK